MNPQIPRIGPVVYYIQRPQGIKIGHTVNLGRRMRELRVREVLAIEPGSRSTELERHAEFATDRIDRQSETFRPSPQLMAHIARLRDEMIPVPYDVLQPRPRRARGLA